MTKQIPSSIIVYPNNTYSSTVVSSIIMVALLNLSPINCMNGEGNNAEKVTPKKDTGARPKTTSQSERRRRRGDSTSSRRDRSSPRSFETTGQQQSSHGSISPNSLTSSFTRRRLPSMTTQSGRSSPRPFSSPTNIPQSPSPYQRNPISSIITQFQQLSSLRSELSDEEMAKVSEVPDQQYQEGEYGIEPSWDRRRSFVQRGPSGQWEHSEQQRRSRQQRPSRQQRRSRQSRLQESQSDQQDQQMLMGRYDPSQYSFLPFRRQSSMINQMDRGRVLNRGDQLVRMGHQQQQQDISSSNIKDNSIQPQPISRQPISKQPEQLDFNQFLQSRHLSDIIPLTQQELINNHIPLISSKLQDINKQKNTDPNARQQIRALQSQLIKLLLTYHIDDIRFMQQELDCKLQSLYWAYSQHPPNLSQGQYRNLVTIYNDVLKQHANAKDKQKLMALYIQLGQLLHDMETPQSQYLLRRARINVEQTHNTILSSLATLSIPHQQYGPHFLEKWQRLKSQFKSNSVQFIKIRPDGRPDQIIVVPGQNMVPLPVKGRRTMTERISLIQRESQQADKELTKYYQLQNWSQFYRCGNLDAIFPVEYPQQATLYKYAVTEEQINILRKSPKFISRLKNNIQRFCRGYGYDVMNQQLIPSQQLGPGQGQKHLSLRLVYKMARSSWLMGQYRHYLGLIRFLQYLLRRGLGFKGDKNVVKVRTDFMRQCPLPPLRESIIRLKLRERTTPYKLREKARRYARSGRQQSIDQEPEGDIQFPETRQTGATAIKQQQSPQDAQKKKKIKRLMEINNRQKMKRTGISQESKGATSRKLMILPEHHQKFEEIVQKVQKYMRQIQYSQDEYIIPAPPSDLSHPSRPSTTLTIPQLDLSSSSDSQSKPQTSRGQSTRDQPQKPSSTRRPDPLRPMPSTLDISNLPRFTLPSQRKRQELTSQRMLQILRSSSDEQNDSQRTDPQQNDPRQGRSRTIRSSKYRSKSAPGPTEPVQMRAGQVYDGGKAKTVKGISWKIVKTGKGSLITPVSTEIARFTEQRLSQQVAAQVTPLRTSMESMLNQMETFYKSQNYQGVLALAKDNVMFPIVKNQPGPNDLSKLAFQAIKTDIKMVDMVKRAAEFIINCWGYSLNMQKAHSQPMPGANRPQTNFAPRIYRIARSLQLLQANNQFLSIIRIGQDLARKGSDFGSDDKAVRMKRYFIQQALPPME